MFSNYNVSLMFYYSTAQTSFTAQLLMNVAVRQGQHTMLIVPRSWLPGRSLYMWWWSHFQRKCRRGRTCNMYCVCTHWTLWPLRWHSKAICWPSLLWPSSTFCCSLPLNCESYILIKPLHVQFVEDRKHT